MELKIIQVCEDCIELIFEQKISQEINSVVSYFFKIFDQKEFKTKFNIKEICPSYASILIVFNSQHFNLRKIKKQILIIQSEFEKKDLQNQKEFNSGKTFEIPVCYEDEFAPDIKNVCEHSKLSKSEVIKLHTKNEYLIYMLGFLPGFPYLGGLDKVLETPRLKTPRTKIPSGSVAIGGNQTGIYSLESPGGWQIIGKTPVKTFDISKTPSVFFNAGDKIKFVPITKEEFYKIENEQSSNDSAFQKKERRVVTGGIKILNAGAFTTVQDFGRSGFLKSGITENGAFDKFSYELSNLILGNKKNAAALETTLFGPEIYFTTSACFCITGADIEPTLNGRKILQSKKISANAGDILKTGFAKNGIRSYISFSGGILVKEFFDSKSTNIKAKFGGYYGRKLLQNDELAIGDEKEKSFLNFIQNKFFLQKKLLKKSLKNFMANEPLVLNVYKGAQFDFFSDKNIFEFTQTEFEIAPESDRMGIRLNGEALSCKTTDIISDAIPFGAVQITSKGLPIIMANDRQTCGGYAKIATVKKEDMYRLSQCKTGTKIKFKFNKK